MVIENKPQPLRPGNIVEIINPSDEHLKGCKGEVLTVDPLTIAVVHVLRFEANQVEKVFDADDFDSKAQLVEAAESLGIQSKGSATKEDIIDKIKARHQHLGRSQIVVDEEVVGDNIEPAQVFASRGPQRR